MKPRTTRILKIGAFSLFAFIGIVTLIYSFLPWADLRPDALRTATIDPALERAGRAILERATRAHGFDAIRAHQTMSITARDTWVSDSWWPEPAQRLRSDRILGTFTSRVELLGGPEDGHVRGIQNWHPYRTAPGGKPQFRDADQMIEFYLPTLHYFDELPFRLSGAEIVLDAGEATIEGKRYLRVFATWQTHEPGEHADQYILWIDPDTNLVRKATYTVRDGTRMSPAIMVPLMRFIAVGTMHYKDYRDVDGVMIPFTQYVTLGTAEKTKLPLDSNYFHMLEVEDVRFDAVDEGDLLPDPKLGSGGDAKPDA